MIYADNAATTKLDKDALEAMIPRRIWKCVPTILIFS